jgi:hypothetical protein
MKSRLAELDQYRLKVTLYLSTYKCVTINLWQVKVNLIGDESHLRIGLSIGFFFFIASVYDIIIDQYMIRSKPQQQPANGVPVNLNSITYRNKPSIFKKLANTTILFKAQTIHSFIYSFFYLLPI